MKINHLGIMQGRLLPKIKNRYQAFPGSKWIEEFYLASKLKLKFIEFIFDKGNLKSNPLFSKNGNKLILNIQGQTNVKVISVCADYFLYNTILIKDKKNLNIEKKYY